METVTDASLYQLASSVEKMIEEDPTYKARAYDESSFIIHCGTSVYFNLLPLIGQASKVLGFDFCLNTKLDRDQVDLRLKS